MGNRLSKIYTRTGDDGTTTLADGRRVSKADDIFWLMGDVDELNSHIGMARAYLAEQTKLDKQHGTQVRGSKKVKDGEEKNSQAKNNQATVAAIPASAIPAMHTQLDEQLSIIQHLLFNVGGELAMPEYQGIELAHVVWLEQQIDAMNAQLKPLKDFILPAGSLLVSQLHVARSVCRRAERQAATINQQRHRSDKCRQATLSQNQTSENKQTITPEIIATETIAIGTVDKPLPHLRPTLMQLLNRLSDWLFVAARFCTQRSMDSEHSEVLWNAQILKDIGGKTVPCMTDANRDMP